MPLLDSTNNSILDKNSLVKLRVFDLNSNGNVTFKLEKNFEFLKLERSSGKLWFIRDKFELAADESEKVVDDIVVTAENSLKSSARVSIVLRVKKYSDLNAFCMTENACFYDQITHHIVEDSSNDFKSREIGELSPKIFPKLCKSFSVSYKQINGEDKILNVQSSKKN